MDADLVARQVVEESAQKLSALFGPGILSNGKVDRKALGNIVFHDPEKLQLLNRTVHPETCRRIKVMADRVPEGLVVIEAIELLHTNLTELVDSVWVVEAEDETRIQRMMKQRGLTREEAESRVKSQWSNEEYEKAADVVIHSTDGPVEDLYRQCDEALSALYQQDEK